MRALAALLCGGLGVRTKSCSGDITALGWLLRPELAQQERLLVLRAAPAIASLASVHETLAASVKPVLDLLYRDYIARKTTPGACPRSTRHPERASLH